MNNLNDFKITLDPQSVQSIHQKRLNFMKQHVMSNQLLLTKIIEQYNKNKEKKEKDEEKELMKRLNALQEQQNKMYERAQEIAHGKKKAEKEGDSEFQKETDKFTQFLKAINENLSGVAAAGAPAKAPGTGAGVYQKPINKVFMRNGKRVPPPLAALPPNLLPKSLGGEGGRDVDVGDEGNRRNNLSTFKKIKDVETLQIEAER